LSANVPDQPNMQNPTVTITPVQIIAVVTMIVTELVNDAVIDGNTAKLITGIAGIAVPFVWIIADAVIHHAHAKLEAAKVLASPQNNVTNVTV